MTGIHKSDTQRYHFDIYAMLEGAQEMYFGHEVQVNVNQVERVTIEGEGGEKMLKCYLSPTKRRGVERRALLWAPHKDGQLLSDALGCGIPKTCAKITCPICYVYGALEAGKNTLIGRVTHGGGVAVQALDAEEKQRAMHPSDLVRGKGGETPIPFRREYNEPGLFYPVYNHALSVNETEFVPVAYAFLDSLARLGAGNPKGAKLAEHENKILLVVDQYLVPKGKRPVISPHLTDPKEAKAYFVRQTESVRGETLTFGESTKSESAEVDMFKRWTGDKALAQLEAWSETFVKTHLVK
jgi:hypothetical protein